MDYNPWKPITNPLHLKLLGKLAEELAECNAAVARCLIQGIDENEPVTGKSNRKWLEEEMADVVANISLVADHFNFDYDKLEKRATLKVKRLRDWHKMT